MQQNGTLRRPHSLQVIAGILVLAVVYVAQPVLAPMALALLLSVLLAPLSRAIERLGVRRAIAVPIVSVLAALVVAAIGWLVVLQARQVAANFPTYSQNVSDKVRDLQASAKKVFDGVSQFNRYLRREGASKPASKALAGPLNGPIERPIEDAELLGPPAPEREEDGEPVKVEVVSPATAKLETATRALGSAVKPVITLTVAFVLAIFLLIWREDVRDRVIRVFGTEDIYFATRAIDETAASVSRYLSVLFLINALCGSAVALGLWLLGIPSALLWGLLFALLRFMPLVGTLIATILPILLSLAVFDNWSYPFFVIGLYVAVDAVSSNLLEPLLYGTRTAASPLAVLFAVLVWTWLWGPIGLLLAMPITISLVALGRYVPQLSFLTTLLGNQPALPEELMLYQRLLTDDVARARRVLDKGLAGPPADRYEALVLPVLFSAKADQERGTLDAATADALRKRLADLLQERHAESRASAQTIPVKTAPPGLGKTVILFCVAAHGPEDELAARIVADLLIENGYRAQVLAEETLAGELLQTLDTQQAQIVCIAALGDHSRLRARYLAKRLVKDHPDLTVVVGLWGVSNSIAEAAEEFALGGDISVGGTLARVMEMIEQRALAVELKHRAAARPAPA